MKSLGYAIDYEWTRARVASYRARGYSVERIAELSNWPLASIKAIGMGVSDAKPITTSIGPDPGAAAPVNTTGRRNHPAK